VAALFPACHRALDDTALPGAGAPTWEGLAREIQERRPGLPSSVSGLDAVLTQCVTDHVSDACGRLILT
jgi:hypothetical protein